MTITLNLPSGLILSLKEGRFWPEYASLRSADFPRP